MNAREVSSHGEWMSFVGFLTPPECDEIVRLCSTYASRKPEIVGEEEAPERRQGTMRRLPREARSRWIYETILGLARDANDRHFGLDLHDIVKDPEYVEYEAGCGRFDWHNDYGQERPISRRKMTVSVQLSAPEEYEGGELELFDARHSVMPKERGSITVFPSFYYHRVRPVVAGTRRALVAWIAGTTLR